MALYTPQPLPHITNHVPARYERYNGKKDAALITPTLDLYQLVNAPETLAPTFNEIPWCMDYVPTNAEIEVPTSYVPNLAFITATPIIKFKGNLVNIAYNSSKLAGPEFTIVQRRDINPACLAYIESLLLNKAANMQLPPSTRFWELQVSVTPTGVLLTSQYLTPQLEARTIGAVTAPYASTLFFIPYQAPETPDNFAQFHNLVHIKTIRFGETIDYFIPIQQVVDPNMFRYSLPLPKDFYLNQTPFSDGKYIYTPFYHHKNPPPENFQSLGLFSKPTHSYADQIICQVTPVPVAESIELKITDFYDLLKKANKPTTLNDIRSVNVPNQSIFIAPYNLFRLITTYPTYLTDVAGRKIVLSNTIPPDYTRIRDTIASIDTALLIQGARKCNILRLIHNSEQPKLKAARKAQRELLAQLKSKYPQATPKWLQLTPAEQTQEGNMRQKLEKGSYVTHPAKIKLPLNMPIEIESLISNLSPKLLSHFKHTSPLGQVYYRAQLPPIDQLLNEFDDKERIQFFEALVSTYFDSRPSPALLLDLHQLLRNPVFLDYLTADSGLSLHEILGKIS